MNPRIALTALAFAALVHPATAQLNGDDFAGAIVGTAEICNAAIENPADLVAGCTVALNNIEMPELRALILLRRGIAALQLGNAVAAKADAHAALLLQQDLPMAWKLLGDAEASTNDLFEALSAYSTVIAIEPNNQEALVARATINHALGADGRCIRDVDAVLVDGIDADGVAPSKTTALALRGMCRNSQGDAAGAVSDLETVLKVADVPVVRAALSSALLASGQTEKAYAAAERAVAQDPTDPVTIQALVSSMIVDGRQPEALERLDQLAAAQPESAAVGNVVAWINYLVGDVERASEAISNFADVEDPQVQDTVAHIHIALGEKDEALAAFGRAIELGGYTMAEQYREQLVALGIQAFDGDSSTLLQAMDKCIDDLEADCRLLDVEDYPWLEPAEEL